MIYNIKWLPLYIFDSIFEITDIVVFTTIIMYNKHIYLMYNLVFSLDTMQYLL